MRSNKMFVHILFTENFAINAIKLAKKIKRKKKKRKETFSLTSKFRPTSKNISVTRGFKFYQMLTLKHITLNSAFLNVY